MRDTFRVTSQSSFAVDPGYADSDRDRESHEVEQSLASGVLVRSITINQEARQALLLAQVWPHSPPPGSDLPLGGAQPRFELLHCNPCLGKQPHESMQEILGASEGGGTGLGERCVTAYRARIGCALHRAALHWRRAAREREREICARGGAEMRDSISGEDWMRCAPRRCGQPSGWWPASSGEGPGPPAGGKEVAAPLASHAPAGGDGLGRAQRLPSRVCAWSGCDCG